MELESQSRNTWNLGGFIGGAGGSTAWMLVAIVSGGWQPVGIVVGLLCVLVVWLAVPVLWSNRSRLSELTGFSVLLAVIFVATAVFLWFCHVLDLPLVNKFSPSQPKSASSYWWILLMFPAMWILLWALDRRNPTNKE